MMTRDYFGNLSSLRLTSLDYEKSFLVVANLTLPSINGADSANHIDTGRRFLPHKLGGELLGRLFSGTGDQSDQALSPVLDF